MPGISKVTEHLPTTQRIRKPQRQHCHESVCSHTDGLLSTSGAALEIRDYLLERSGETLIRLTPFVGHRDWIFLLPGQQWMNFQGSLSWLGLQGPDEDNISAQHLYLMSSSQ